MRPQVLAIAALLVVQAATLPAQTLPEAVRAQDAAAITRLLAAQADVNAQLPDGSTALHWAVHNGAADLVARLLKAGAHVSQKNDYGATAMSEAAELGDAAIIKLLL
ncbi:MAG: ankyrin repeat domain-containing protein, partial [Pseudomonadota bacterium]